MATNAVAATYAAGRLADEAEQENEDQGSGATGIAPAKNDQERARRLRQDRGEYSNLNVGESEFEDPRDSSVEPKNEQIGNKSEEGSQQPGSQEEGSDRNDRSGNMPDALKDAQEKPTQQEGEKEGESGPLNEEETGSPEQEQNKGLFSQWQRYQEMQGRQSSLRERALASNNLENANVAKAAAGAGQTAAAAEGSTAAQVGTAAAGAAVKRGLFGLIIRNPWVLGGIAGFVLLSGLFIFVTVGGVAYVCYVDKGFVGNTLSWFAQLTGMVQCPTDSNTTQTEAQRIQEEYGSSMSEFRGAEI